MRPRKYEGGKTIGPRRIKRKSATITEEWKEANGIVIGTRVRIPGGLRFLTKLKKKKKKENGNGQERNKNEEKRFIHIIIKKKIAG